jgi:hypothetical protein
MRFALGFWDSLLGRKHRIDLVDGERLRTVRVSNRWLDDALLRGLQLEPGGIVRVNRVTPGGADVVYAEIGTAITAETAIRRRDPQSGQLYCIASYVNKTLIFEWADELMWKTCAIVMQQSLEAAFGSSPPRFVSTGQHLPQ